MPTFLRSLVLVVLGAAVLALGPLMPRAEESDTGPRKIARLFEIQGPIGPPLADYIADGFAQARADDVAIIILEMDTPGGLDTSMRRIIKEILASPIPVATFVAPGGARAASAGTYILYASHIAAMAPSTNLGAATPVELGGGSPLPSGDDKPTPPDTPTDSDDKADESKDAPAMSNEDSMRAKVVNDASAYIKGLAELRGRNAEWAVKAVREAASLSAREAADMHVIDFVASDVDDVLAQADGRTVKIAGSDVVLAVKGATIERVAPDWATAFFATITDPTVAFLLMTLGFYGLFFELTNPGSYLPGTVGVIALILGLYAFSVLPVNMAGAALLLVGVVLMGLEAFVPSFGALGIGGLIAFALGASLLFDTDAPDFQLSWQVIVATTLATGAFFAAIAVFAVGAQRRYVETGAEYLMRQTGIVDSWHGQKGWVLVHGERWSAISDGPLVKGQKVKIDKIDNLVLTVIPLA